MNNTRFVFLDNLRAFSIVIVIVTHVLSRNLGTEAINRIWNYLHFVVPLFVFCSGYLIYRSHKESAWGKYDVFPLFRKRATRLIIPYYGYLAFHYVLWLVFPGFFSGFGLSKSIAFITSSIIFFGVDYGWLPLLFLELMVLTPFLMKYFVSSHRRIVGATGAFLISVIFLYVHIPIDYRLIMWLPWCSVYLLSFEAASRGMFDTISTSRTPLLLVVLIAGIGYGFISLSLLKDGPMTLTLHKYPPDAFYLLYAICIGSLVAYVLSWIQRPHLITQWLSREAYALYFAHYIVMDFFRTIVSDNPGPILGQITTVLCMSMGIVWLIGKLQNTILRFGKAIAH